MSNDILQGRIRERPVCPRVPPGSQESEECPTLAKPNPARVGHPVEESQGVKGAPPALLDSIGELPKGISFAVRHPQQIVR